MKSIMKKLLVLVSAALLLAGLSTSCNKVGCHCYLKTDVMHLAPEYEGRKRRQVQAVTQQMKDGGRVKAPAVFLYLAVRFYSQKCS